MRGVEPHANTWHAPPTSATTGFAIFAALFAAAMLFHEAKWTYASQHRLDVLLIAAAILVLVRPSSVGRSVLMHLLVLAIAIGRSPWISNHFFFASVMSLTVLLALVREVLRDSNCRTLATRAYAALAPAVRIGLIGLYAWSAFHKLNSDFLDPQLSCGSAMYLDLARIARGWLPQGPLAQLGAIYATVLCEGLMAIFLVVRRTRAAGILLAILFHLVMGVAGFGNFSSICIAALFTFVSPLELPPPPARLATLWRRIAPGVTAMVVLVSGGALLLFEYWGSPSPGVLFDPGMDAQSPGPLRDAFRVLWLFYGLVCTAAAVVIWKRGAVVARVGLPPALLAIAPILLLFNGLCPYLGLKTENSFSMFSNLRTEAGACNHLIVREPLAQAGYQHDMVRIITTSDLRLRRFAQARLALTYFEFQSYAARKAKAGEADFAVTYERNGRMHALIRVSDDPDLVRPQPWLVRKLLYFRPVKFGKANTCGH